MQTKPALHHHLQQQHIVDADTAQQLAAESSPWWLQLLLGIAAWIASILIISSSIGPILALGDSNAVRVVLATVLLAAAIWLAGKPQEFLQQMSVAIALAGQGLLVYVLYDALNNNDEAARYGCMLFSSLLLLSPLNAVHQRVSISIAVACLLSLITSAPAVAVLSVAVAAGAVAAWCSRPHWTGLPFANRLKSLLEVATLAALGLSLFGQGLLLIDSSSWLNDQLLLAQALYSALGSVLLLSTVFWLSRLATVPSRLVLLSITTLLCIVLYPASGLLIGSALMLACFYGCSQRWVALSLLSMLFALSQFYYSLQLTLLYKSALLALSGMLVLAAWLLLQRYQRRLL